MWKMGWARAMGVVVTVLVGCGDSEPPTAISDEVLSLRAFQTATDLDSLGIRVQVRMRVTEGLGDLTARIASSAAFGEVCLGTECARAPIGTAAVDKGCPAAGSDASNAELRISGAWLNGDAVGINFCVREIAGSQSFDLRVVSDGMTSNTTRTLCTRLNSLVICGSN